MVKLLFTRKLYLNSSKLCILYEASPLKGFLNFSVEFHILQCPIKRLFHPLLQKKKTAAAAVGQQAVRA